MSVLIDLHFLPSLEYFCALLPHQEIVLEKHEHFNKQSFRSRCYIMAANGIERLTIPLTAKSGKVMITDVQLDNRYRWQTNMLRTLDSAYANAPFYEYYKDDLRKEILSNQKFLYDFNLRLLSLCLHWLKWDKTISESVSYVKEMKSDDIDLRGLISAKIDFKERKFYQAQPYPQVFGSTFVPNLSVIDLVFNEGPHAANVVVHSARI